MAAEWMRTLACYVDSSSRRRRLAVNKRPFCDCAFERPTKCRMQNTQVP